jgi:3-hydroxy-9,10-secoandrosta-1,3,5(10)-triene-9,17-dione monooxygenase reductase component
VSEICAGPAGPLVTDDGAAWHFRRVLGSFATGVVIVTTVAQRTGFPLGLTANSFTSVSLSPPLVSICMARTSSTWPLIRAAEGHCINVLAEHQRGLCRQFAASGGDKFSQVRWTASPAGHPILGGVLGWLDCRVEAEYPAGDHVIVVCRVMGLDVLSDEPPLIFYRGEYGRFTSGVGPGLRVRRRLISPRRPIDS